MLDATEVIKKIREEDCKRYCTAIPHAGCNSCRAGAAIEALSMIGDSSAITNESLQLSPQDAIVEIRGEECCELCGRDNIPNENCSSCRWNEAIIALQKWIHSNTCRSVGIDMLGQELRINDEVVFTVEHERHEGIIQSRLPKGMLIINALSGQYRRKPSSILKRREQ